METVRTKEALVEFLDYVAQKGLVAPATAQARRVAVNAVFGVLDESETRDVLAIDLPSAMVRFSNLQGKGYTPDSLKTYQSRLKAAINDFASYLENPLSFKPNSQTREKRSNQKKAPSTEAVGDTPSLHAESPRPASPLGPVGSSIFPIPLRKDLTIQIYGLPFDLTESEARRIAAVVQAMAVVD